MSTPIAQPSSYTEVEVTRNKVKCKVKYRIRWFYSRGSFLVLIWNILIIAAVDSQLETFYSENLYILWIDCTIKYYFVDYIFSSINCVTCVYSTLWMVS